MRHPLLPMLLLLALAAVPRAEAATVIADRVRRYVNDDVITSQDVLLRFQLLLGEQRRRGQGGPATRDDLLRLHAAALEELTDEALLLQQSKQMQILIDARRIQQQVRRDAKKFGLNRDLEAQTRRREDLERQARIDQVLDFHLSRIAPPTPAELHALYQERTATWQRPATVRVWRLVLRPADAKAQAETRTRLLQIFQEAAGSGDPAVKALDIEACRTAYLAAAEADRPAILAAFLDRVAGAVADDAGAALRALGKRSREAVDAWKGLRTWEQAQALLDGERAGLLAVTDPAARLERFRESARRLGQDSRAVSGGDLGWIEASSLGEEQSKLVDGLAVSEPSQPLRSGDTLCLLLVSERREAGVRAFAEVAGELAAGLRKQREQQARRELLARLRSAASIRDVLPSGQAETDPVQTPADDPRGLDFKPES